MFFTKHRNRSKSLRAHRGIFPDFGIESLEPRRLFSSLVVTTVDDSTSHPGFVSLRDAITTANTDARAGTSDTISFAASLNGQTIMLQQGQLELGQGGAGRGVITINGANQITVSGNGVSGIFRVDPSVSVIVNALTITDGNSPSIPGGAIYNDFHGSLTLEDCTVSGNSAPTAVGGAIFNDGTMSVSNSAFSGNASGDSGGCIYNSNTMTVTNCTFLQDSAGRRIRSMTRAAPCITPRR